MADKHEQMLFAMANPSMVALMPPVRATRTNRESVQLGYPAVVYAHTKDISALREWTEVWEERVGSRIQMPLSVNPIASLFNNSVFASRLSIFRQFPPKGVRALVDAVVTCIKANGADRTAEHYASLYRHYSDHGSPSDSENSAIAQMSTVATELCDDDFDRKLEELDLKRPRVDRP